MANFKPKTHGDAHPTTGKRRRRMEIDVERYQALLDSSELTAAQKHDLIRTLWTIIGVVTDLGLEVSPAQAVLSERP